MLVAAAACLLLLPPQGGPGSATSKATQTLVPEVGSWLGWLDCPGGELQFEMRIQRQAGGYRLTVINGPERIHYDQVTVEAGVTWAALYETLSRENLRTPFWGPFSGIAATIGGGMSHYAVNYGSGLYGVSAESLISMDVILGNGEMISTGSGGGGKPHLAQGGVGDPAKASDALDAAAKLARETAAAGE